MANKIHNLPETKGQFQVRGIVTGTEKDNFYTEKLTSSNRPFRSVNFGVQFNKNATMYVGFNGMEQDYVYFSKRIKDDKTGKVTIDIKKVPWKDRFTFEQEGYRLIGVNLGVSKKLDSTGKEVNDKKILTQYDGCKEVADNLQDDKSVFVRGNITYSTYNDRHQVRFEPSQISLCRDVDFEDEDFTEMAKFQQVIVFMGIEKDEKEKNNFIVSAKIVNYNSIEDAEFYIQDVKLANLFRKNLKPYTAIKVWGNITVIENVEQVTDEDDFWGEANEMERINQPTQRRLVITGADPKTIDKEVYAKEKIEEAIASINASKQAKKDFGDLSDDDNDDDGWGTSESDLDDEPWD